MAFATNAIPVVPIYPITTYRNGGFTDQNQNSVSISVDGLKCRKRIANYIGLGVYILIICAITITTSATNGYSVCSATELRADRSGSPLASKCGTWCGCCCSVGSSTAYGSHTSWRKGLESPRAMPPAVAPGAVLSHAAGHIPMRAVIRDLVHTCHRGARAAPAYSFGAYSRRTQEPAPCVCTPVQAIEPQCPAC